MDRLDLNETGTRYQFYAELAEFCRSGVEIISNMNPTIRKESDLRTLRKLEAAVDIIERRLNFLAEYGTKSISMWRTIDAIRPLLTEGTSANDKASS